MARKRYHQSAKDRSDEKRGMEKAMHKKYGEYKQSAKDREDEKKAMKKAMDKRSGKYHQSAKDRKDESRGMERAMHRRSMMKEDKYSGMEPRRRQEMEDAGMIREDHRAVANLPQEVRYQAYPRIDYDSYDLNDDIRGIDVQMDDDVRKERRKSGERYPEKY